MKHLRGAIISTVAALLTVFISHQAPLTALAGGGRITLDSSTGVAGGSAATVTATVYVDDAHTAPDVGASGSFAFQSPTSGQSCSANASVTDAQGRISAQCSSATAGQFVVTFTTGSESPRTVAVTFSQPQQQVSGTYKLIPSSSNITFSNQVNTGYGMNVRLLDAANDQLIVNQSDITYSWISRDSSIVQIESTNSQCLDNMQSPCPNLNGQFAGYKPGTTVITIQAKKNGLHIAEATVTVTITQTTSGSSRYSPPPSIAPASTTPTPTPSSTTKTSATPKASAKPGSSVEPSPSPEASPEETPSPSPSASPNAELAGQSSDGGVGGLVAFMVIAIIFGLGVPIGWYVVSSNPKLEEKLQTWLKKFRRQHEHEKSSIMEK